MDQIFILSSKNAKAFCRNKSFLWIPAPFLPHSCGFLWIPVDSCLIPVDSCGFLSFLQECVGECKVHIMKAGRIIIIRRMELQIGMG